MGPRTGTLGIAAALIQAVVAVAGLSACGSGRDGASGSPARNLLLVTLDTTRADRLGCYGYRGGTTPHLDSLARDGIVFELAISPSASTPPAHASILTGLNPYLHGVRVISAPGGHHLAEPVPTLAEVLQREGWTTGAFLSSFTVSEYFGFERGFDAFDNGIRDPADAALQTTEHGTARWDVARNQRRSDRTTDALLAWLEHARRPFFAWIHYWDPHDPQLLPPRAVLRRFATQTEGGRMDRGEIYDAEIFFVDHQLGRLLRALEEWGLYDETAIMVIGDHGEGLGDHGWDRHRRLWQEQIHVPLIVRLPDGPRGHRVEVLVRSIDLFPTALDVLEVDASAPVQGRSLMAPVSGEADASRMAYAEQLNQWDTNADRTHCAPPDQLLYSAVDRSWKLIYRARTPEQSELYHLADDPDEETNLWSEDHPEYQRLKRALDAHGGYRFEPFSGAPVDPAALERLRSLGYVE